MKSRNQIWAQLNMLEAKSFYSKKHVESPEIYINRAGPALPEAQAIQKIRWPDSRLSLLVKLLFLLETYMSDH